MRRKDPAILHVVPGRMRDFQTVVPGPGRTGMRVCFVVNNVRTQKATYTTLCLAFAGHRRGHDVAFASVDAFSQGEGPEIVADVVRPKPGRLRDAAAYARALTSLVRAARGRTPGRLRRRLPAQQPERGRERRRSLQSGARLRPPAQVAGRARRQRPGRAVARGLEDVPRGVPGGAAAAHAHHALDRARARRSCASSTGPPSSSPSPASAGRTSSTSRAGRRPTCRR